MKLLGGHFVETGKLNSIKCIWKGKGSRIAKTTLKKNKIEELILSDFKTYKEATVLKTSLILV